MRTLSEPGDAPRYTPRTPRVSAAVKLHRRREREKTGRFLAEGPQAVREALAAGAVRELFVTDDGWRRHRDLVTDQAPWSLVTDEAMAALADTVTPQGIVAVCDLRDTPLEAALAERPHHRPWLIAVAVDVRDPGNAGTILRTADAAGADLMIFAGESVDPYNSKAVRASAGSVFHLTLARERAVEAVLAQLAAAGVRTFATSGYAARDLDNVIDSGELAGSTAWVFGSEAHGLPEAVVAGCDSAVRVPIYGGAESLNLATAAAICLYASARARRP